MRSRFFLALIFALAASTACGAEPLALNADNPHYFQFRGKPTILITSAEHYGAVLNSEFDYVRYLDELASCGLNHTPAAQRYSPRRLSPMTSPCASSQLMPNKRGD